MAATTFRQLLNRILVNVSEDELASGESEISETYHKLIRNFINIFKEEIEESHNWSCMRKTCTATVSAGNKVSTNMSDGSAFIPSNSRLARLPVPEVGYIVPIAFDVTTAGEYYRLKEVDLKWTLHEQLVRTAVPEKPCEFSLDPSNTVIVARFPNKFSVQRSLQFEFYVPQDAFDGDASDIDTAINLPVAAIRALELGVTWHALEERGEELGTNVNFTEQRYRIALDAAINRDDAEGSGNDYELVPV